MLTEPSRDPIVSIVILSYNRREELRRGLTAIGRMTFSDKEVIVVDNHSDDGSPELVRAEFPGVTLIESGRNLGVSGGRNLGFRRCRGTYILYLDDDSVAPDGICETTVSTFAGDERLGCLAFRVRNQPGERYFGTPSHPRWLGNYHGAAHAFRSAALRAIDFLDERFFFGGEEIDSSLRLLESGYRVRYTPEVTVDHYPRAASEGPKSRRLSHWIASFGWFYFKHFPLGLALLFLFRLLITHSVHAVRIGALHAVASGGIMFLRGLPGIWRGRRLASPSTIAFYRSPKCVPGHFNEPLIRKVLDGARSAVAEAGVARNARLR